MNIMKCTLLIAVMALPCFTYAQRFLSPTETVSGKKISYLTMDDGTEVQCNVKKLKFSKGLIEELKIVDLDGNKVKIKPEEIDHMYLPPMGIEKMTKAVDFVSDATLWNEDELDGDLFADGYVLYEKANVRIKKKTEVMMLQLLNPHFSNKIRVYNDPLSGETGSMSVGGVKVAGGLAKSYYVMTDDVAVKLKKKDYDEQFPLYFKSCPDLVNQYKDDIEWGEFVNHIYTYATDCK